MEYTLKTRETKKFELYNDLEVGDKAEVAVFLKAGEGPGKNRRKVDAEELWVQISDITYEAKNIYNAVLTEEPRYLKQLHSGHSIAFSPENVLKAKRKKTIRKPKTIEDFIYDGKSGKWAGFRNVITDGSYSYAVDPDSLIIRTERILKRSVNCDGLNQGEKDYFEKVVSRFDDIEEDKYHIRIGPEFIRKSREKTRSRLKLDPLKTNAALVRVSDRTFLSYRVINRLVSLSGNMLIYHELEEEFPMLYFRSKRHEGFIALAHQKSDSIVIDIVENLVD